MKLCVAGTTVGLALAAFFSGAAEAGPNVPELVSHLAVYSMNLSSTSLSGGVTGASGNMVYKFADSCDGWTVENRTALTFSYSDGAPVATTWEFLTWESKNGRDYRFRVRSTRDGVVSEEVDGTAMLDANHAGVAKFTLPEQKTLRLPRGTVFPTEHTVRILEAAAKGQHVLNKMLFDGTTADGAFNVNALIGREAPANANISPASSNPAVDMRLLSGPSWHVEMAFFPEDSADAAPDYEVALRYYGNGVADEVIQSFGSFTLKGTLDRLQILPKPDC